MEDSDPRPRGAQPRGRPRRGGPPAPSHRARDPAPRGGGVCGNGGGFGLGPGAGRVGSALPGFSGFAWSLVPGVRAFAGYGPRRLDGRARGFPKTGYMMLREV